MLSSSFSSRARAAPRSVTSASSSATRASNSATRSRSRSFSSLRRSSSAPPRVAGALGGAEPGAAAAPCGRDLGRSSCSVEQDCVCV